MTNVQQISQSDNHLFYCVWVFGFFWLPWRHFSQPALLFSMDSFCYFCLCPSFLALQANIQDSIQQIITIIAVTLIFFLN